MSKTSAIVVVLMVCFGLVTLASAGEAEKMEKKETKMTIDQVPPPVKETITKEAGKSKISEIQEVAEGEKKTYEAEWKVGKKEIEIKVAPDGKVICRESEEPISLDKLPAPVKETITKQAGENKIKEIKEVVKDNEKSYEAEWEAEGKEMEVKVAPDGKVIERENEQSDDDEDDDKKD